MKIGFIGAGKVGVTLGKYFAEHQIELTGFFSRTTKSAKEAALFTGSNYYETLAELISDSDVVFLTVPDDMIGTLWEKIKKLAVKNKVFCHCSGALSSAVFSNIDQIEGSGYSIHPFFAINDKWTSYKEFSNAFITIEGDKKYKKFWKELFEKWGHSVQFIDEKQKVKYHAAAVFASNQMLALLRIAETMLQECGFEEKVAEKAIMPIVFHNLQNARECGVVHSLTGPVERADISTIEKHLKILNEEQKEIYLLLSQQLLEMAKEKNPQRDYNKMEMMIRKETS